MADENYDKLFQAGNAAQLEKLRENAYKTGWENINLRLATDKIVHHTQNLAGALTWDIEHKGEYDYKYARKKAANIANFAHMIILACDQRISEVKK